MRSCAPRRGPRLEAPAGILALLVLAAPPAQAEEEVRIALVSGRTEVLLSARHLALYDAQVGDLLVNLPGEAKVMIVRDRAGLRVVEAAGGGRTLGRARRILAEASGAVGVDRGVYYGRAEVSLESNGRTLLVVNRLPLETYILGIVGSEMDPSWPAEALKAQAVAARTYAMQRRMMMRMANKPYDLESTVLSQVYKGAERIRPSVIEAVKATRGEVMSYTHDLVEALYHSTCGGETASARAAFGNDVPYLKARSCRWCRASHLHSWKLSVPLDELSKLLERAKMTEGKLRRLERTTRSDRVFVHDPRGRRTVSANKLRAAVGYMKLYSTRFTAKTQGEKVHISGRGFGHGVGMCQWGARGMALEGKSYRDILEYYYQGAGVRRIY